MERFDGMLTFKRICSLCLALTLLVGTLGMTKAAEITVPAEDTVFDAESAIQLEAPEERRNRACNPCGSECGIFRQQLEIL